MMIFQKLKRIIFLYFSATSFFCVAQNETPLFKSLSPEITKVNFENTIIENDTVNYFYYDNLYNGAGVAVGDINNDGLPDIYFVSNQGADQLYLNSGKMKFKNITKKAFPKQDKFGWHTAVSMADVNADGWLDIYVCKHGLGPVQKVNYRNLLYINNGNNTFTERAKEFGVDDPGRSMDADFFDYDQDGDLDLFVTNHRENTCIMDQFKHQSYLEQFHSNRLYQNNDGIFTDVTKKAGVLSFGFCLSTSIGDVNNDGWPDIYITSDYANPDFLFINQQNGTYKNESKERLRHTSHYSMGSDIADFNNDGFADVCVLDMSNKDYVKAKTNMGSMSLGTFLDNVAKGWNYQYMYNTLHINLGSGYFSEIAHLAGIASTDWSWAPLLVDFDQDGLKDLFATNGYFRDVRDKDFTNKVKAYMATKPDTFDIQKMIALIPQSKEINYVFKNNGDLTFSDQSKNWGIDFGTNSNGAAYGDLDNDGDVDLVINNLNEPATILENTTSRKNYLKVKLIGHKENPFAYGAKVIVKTGTNEAQWQELNPSRGYASSSDLILTFGLALDRAITEVKVLWNSKEEATLISPNLNQTLIINYATEKKDFASTVYPFVENPKTQFAKITEAEFDDYRREVLLPQKMSELGPFLSKGFIENLPPIVSLDYLDKNEDLLIGGGKNQHTRIYAQQDGEFILTKQPGLEIDSAYEDAGSVFFDADNDGDEDLYIVSGGNEYDAFSPYYRGRLYMNDGKGNFVRNKQALPAIASSGQCVLANDLDNDKDIDLYVPGRQVPGKYPQKPESIWLVNENGKFTNKILEIAPELQYIGMVTDAIFTDFDNDKDEDLIVVGEWMAPTFFENNNGKFSKIEMLEDENSMFGWWNCIEPVDLNNDGIQEFLVGNLGLNNKFHPTPEYPLSARLSDFDSSGTLDLILSKYFAGVQHPIRGRECLSEQIPAISERFKTYSDFANTPFQEIFNQVVQAEKVTNFSNGVLILENGKYKFHPFQNFGQIGCINKFIPVELNGDEYIDFIAFGNKYEAEIETPRYDANPGLVFINAKGNEFKIMPLQDFGPFVNKNAKDAIMIGNSIFISDAGESVDRYEVW